MSMLDAIKNFPKQFSYQPEIVNKSKLKKYNTVIIAGMGGSQLAGGILKSLAASLNVIQHRNYSFPAEASKKTLVIASSYSGNTEEVIDSFQLALKKKIPVVAVAAGGALLSLAQKAKVPYIELPDKTIEPRSAIGYNLQALLALTSQTKIQKEVSQLSSTLVPSDFEPIGKALAQKIQNHIPLIYSSVANEALAYFWKITLNETAKSPAFYNLFPELNHNEMTSFEKNASTQNLTKQFVFLLLEDAQDHPRIQKRLAVFSHLISEMELPIENIPLVGNNRAHTLFNSILLAEWTAYYASQLYRTNPDQVPMIEEFKKLMNQ